MLRYLRLFATQVRASTLLALQYRYEFFGDAVLSVFWTLTALVPLWVVYSNRATVAGWRYGEALLVVGWFTLLQGVIEGAISPSLSDVVERIRKGTLDFVLLKPADSQFLVSTTKFMPWRIVNVGAAFAIFAYGFSLEQRLPSAWGLVGALFLMGSSTLLLYSLWILTVSVAFYVVKVDNLSYLFTSVFDAARWPADVFRGALAFVFTFIIPLAVMTTYPARAMLGSLSLLTLLASVRGSLVFASIARWVWQRAIASYTSASS